ncbi:MAG: hypothetical protein E7190_00160 [Erysipelotrichaceae bacterium]|nr:hypothetical protein [Erysipelotrichaceae bacterium]
MEIKKIVITGGPCAGKTTAMSWISNHFTRMGWCVLFVPETATELISGGVAPWTCGTNLDYQKCQVRLQLTKEELFEQAARTMKQDKILIVCDRGFMDNKAYMTDEEFEAAAASVNGNIVDLRDGYDAVFHLVTAANGAAEYYTTENNAARYETVEQAVEMDNRLIAAWTGHPHFRIIDNSTDFEDKMKRLINAIITFLGEPEPIALRRKYLVEYPDIAWLKSNPYARKLDITETYLRAPEGSEYHLKKRDENGHHTYIYTQKKRINALKSLETEKRLTLDDYHDLLEQADPDMRPLHKERYFLSFDRQYFVVDLFPFWDNQAIVSIEVSSEDAEVRMPAELHVIREITEDETFRNRYMARYIA